MKLPETLLIAIGCAALAGCQQSEAGGMAAPAEPTVVEVAVEVDTEVEQSVIPEVGEQGGLEPHKSETSAVAEAIRESLHSNWECGPCGMG